MPSIGRHARTILEATAITPTSYRVLLHQSSSRRGILDLPIRAYQTKTPHPARPFSSTNARHDPETKTKRIGDAHGTVKSEPDTLDRRRHLASRTPPPQGDLSIVFTDIVKSTAIWEQDAPAMVRAMHLHDTMIRTLTEENSGYEVKQNGDGFMIAFHTATSAVRFCLDVQEQLLDEHWPAGILKLPSGEETTDSDGHVLFRGLKLRMSAHWGEPVCNWNEVIQRMDYLGPMVNRAARFIEATEAGQIVVSEELLRQLQAELEIEKGEPSEIETTDACSGRDSAKNEAEALDLSMLRSKRDQKRITHQTFAVQLLGNHQFKGLDEPQKLYFLVPTSLEGRVDHWHQVTHVAGVKGNVRTQGS
ncbi:hypothetical protein LTR72_000377 [Exophiala xenobiotica]|nr:hypothetical protein LTR92_003090 [Exophiala xenobiotica]KAK5213524.1 hypothetical protein LTR41_001103 [Exophiala xenobiotica]KAK5231197.1 hypothetical protein LTR72_000377 [Exophiala xenobiotica]KAK5299711.1 hypothetical protein LTR14_001925 [Exophiala xenobiotica]KAK5383965.1 hypothetical protein LTS13_002157 [Exophiala xenobiotica]